MTTKKQARYDIGLKRQVAVEVVDMGHRQCDVSRQYGISGKLVSNWSQDYRLSRNWAKSDTQKVQDDTLVRLERENKRLRQENEILKKASAYFARNQR